MSAELERELKQLRSALRTMARETETRVQTALEAWFAWDVELARSIRVADSAIDQMELNIENECLGILARHQPVASDLRFVMATLRINTSFERIADLARSIAKRVIRLSERGPKVNPPPAAESMGQAVCEMVKNVINSLEKQDVELARFVRRSDSFVDERNKELFDWALAQIETDPENAGGYMTTVLMARTLERIGDLAGNIAEDIMFVVGGSVVRHSPL
ncbi:MAG: phosphate signaling complex protein PhoU [Phycisphaerales bacterium]|nr:phosphate signaling complex protein PhoU [bacterium]